VRNLPNLFVDFLPFCREREMVNVTSVKVFVEVELIIREGRTVDWPSGATTKVLILPPRFVVARRDASSAGALKQFDVIVRGRGQCA
jgi:hypothetical protein